MRRVILLIGVILSWVQPELSFAQTGLLEKVLSGRGTLIDLTYPLSERAQVWPGGMPFKKELVVDYDKGYRLYNFTMAENVGTHVDAPAHFIKGQLSIDQLPLSVLMGRAVVIHVIKKVAEDPDYRLTQDDLKRWEKTHGRIPRGGIVLMNTGWGTRWADTQKYRNMDKNGIMHFPGFSESAAKFLIHQREINGIGIDTLSLDYGPSKDFAVHQIMLRANKYQIENLANLDKLPASGAIAFVMPIKVEGGSQAEARVFALSP